MDRKERQVAENEVKCLSALKHPYIVRYWESFMHEKFLASSWIIVRVETYSS